ncbi:MAG: response regulator [Anaerolineae bacterium]|nr:response regulator [Anaerolineae bacterium]MDH7475359.1 response regulator [Anaerolineae bacterium]
MSKILVVDDQEEGRYLLEHLLKINGFEVISASNGREALAMAHAERPLMIISDILMPEMDGFSLCRAVKSDEALRSVPFVFYSATYTTPEDEELALSLGAARFIRRPQEPTAFIAEIREVISETAPPPPHVAQVSAPSSPKSGR